jgi:hypothetical protein
MEQVKLKGKVFLLFAGDELLRKVFLSLLFRGEFQEFNGVICGQHFCFLKNENYLVVPVVL